jgi:hypothetical protein
MRTTELRGPSRYVLVACCLAAASCSQQDRTSLDDQIRQAAQASRSDSRADEVYYQGSVNAIDRRDYALALDYLQAAKERDPQDVRVLNALGVVYDKLGRFDLSARYYAQARALDPTSPIIASNMAYSRLLQGAADPALRVAAASPPAAPAISPGLDSGAIGPMAAIPAAVTRIPVVSLADAALPVAQPVAAEADAWSLLPQLVQPQAATRPILADIQKPLGISPDAISTPQVTAYESDPPTPVQQAPALAQADRWPVLAQLVTPQAAPNTVLRAIQKPTTAISPEAIRAPQLSTDTSEPLLAVPQVGTTDASPRVVDAKKVSPTQLASAPASHEQVSSANPVSPAPRQESSRVNPPQLPAVHLAETPVSSSGLVAARVAGSQSEARDETASAARPSVLARVGMAIFRFVQGIWVSPDSGTQGPRTPSSTVEPAHDLAQSRPETIIAAQQSAPVIPQEALSSAIRADSVKLPDFETLLIKTSNLLNQNDMTETPRGRSNLHAGGFAVPVPQARIALVHNDRVDQIRTMVPQFVWNSSYAFQPLASVRPLPGARQSWLDFATAQSSDCAVSAARPVDIANCANLRLAPETGVSDRGGSFGPSIDNWSAKLEVLAYQAPLRRGVLLP